MTAFRTMLKSLGKGEKIAPVLQSILWNPEFEGFDVRVDGFKPRPPDGWFHPSTHPLWDERRLYYYLAEPDQIIAEPFDPHGTIAVTQGHFWHSFLGTILKRAGVLVDTEVYVEHPETLARGSMDGLTADGEIFELKTMDDRKAGKFPQGDPDDPEVVAHFKAKCPAYWAQAQEYMRLSGRTSWRGLIVTLRYPFPMVEVALSPDRSFQYETAEKYRRVIQAAADKIPPRFCCAPGSKEARGCPARGVCPNG